MVIYSGETCEIEGYLEFYSTKKASNKAVGIKHVTGNDDSQLMPFLKEE